MGFHAMASDLATEILRVCSGNGSQVSHFLAFVVAILTAVFFQHRYSGTYRGTYPSPPGPPALPILGNMMQLGAKPFETFTELGRKYGDVISVRMGSHDAVVVNGYGPINEALLKYQGVFAARPKMETFKHIAKGFAIAFNSPSSSWKTQRRTAVQSFSQVMKDQNVALEDFMVQVTDNLSGSLAALSTASAKAIDPKPEVELATASIIFRFCFGERNHEFGARRLVMDTLQQFRTNIVFAVITDMMPWTGVLFRRQVRRFQRCMETYWTAVDQQIEESLRHGGNGELLQRLEGECQRLGADGLERQGLSRSQLLHVVEDVIGAGTETFANFIHWAIFYLAKYPQIQKKAHRELTSVDPDLPTENQNDDGAGNPVYYKNREKLPYIQCLLWEICRHSHLAPITMPHATDRDTVFRGFFIPKDTTVIFNLHSVATDPDVFPDAGEFRPERFLEVQSGTGGNCCDAALDKGKVDRMLLFGLGRRRCLGQQLGRMGMFLVLQRLLRNLSFREDPANPLREGEGHFSATFAAYNYKVIVSPRR